MNLNQEHDKIEKVIRGKNLNIDIYSEHITGEPENIIRLYITSKSLGGLCISNNGDGWIPCFPEKPNYPIKGKWFSPYQCKDQNWINCMLKKLDPVQHLHGIGTVNWGLAKKRNELNINSFRRHAAIAIFKNLLESEG